MQLIVYISFMYGAESTFFTLVPKTQISITELHHWLYNVWKHLQAPGTN